MAYKHLTFDERENIYLLLKINKSTTEIANELGRSKSAISREIKRNSINGRYTVVQASCQYIKRRRSCGARKKIQSNMKLYRYIEKKLRDYWSPEIISLKWNELHPDDSISFSTIYKAVKEGVFKNITVDLHLRRRGKRKIRAERKPGGFKIDLTIHERPALVAERIRLGDWEGDLVCGGVGKGYLVTLTDRKSRKLLSKRINEKAADITADAVISLLRKYTVNTITFDNGAEFADFRRMEKELNTTVYFADPHSPWQRGTNENINDCLRFFFPKGYDLRKVEDDYIGYVVNIINNRPRKCLGLFSPKQVLPDPS